MAPTFAQGVVAMDNVHADKAAGVQTEIEATGASLLQLTLSSLDFKRIGKALSKLKALLRAKAERKIDDLRGNVDSLIDPTKCRNQYKASGRDPA